MLRGASTGVGARKVNAAPDWKSGGALLVRRFKLRQTIKYRINTAYLKQIQGKKVLAGRLVFDRSCQSGGKKLSGVDAQRWPADSTAGAPRMTAKGSTRSLR
jgi:hypothetical protein